MTEEQLAVLEEYAFYESGLSAHGCFEDLDQYAKEAIQRYGRIIIRVLEKKLDDRNKTFPEMHIDHAPPTYEVAEEVKDIATSLYSVALHLHEVAKQNPVVVIGPRTLDSAYRAIKKYEECNYLNGRINEYKI